MIKYDYPYIFKDNNKPQNPIVFVPGFNSNCNCFERFEKYWTENDYYAVSFPGNSNIEPLHDEEISVPSFSDILIKFCLDNNLKNITLIGHSMGGAIISLAYKKHPDLFKKMLYIAPQNKSSLVTKEKYFETYFPKTFDQFLEFLKTLYYDISEFTNDQKWMAEARKNFNPNDFNNPTILKLGASLPQMPLMDKIEEGLNAINVPCLLVLGEKDGVIDRDNCLKYFKEQVKGVKVEFIPKTGHMMFDESFDAFIKIVAPFIKEK